MHHSNIYSSDSIASRCSQLEIFPMVKMDDQQVRNLFSSLAVLAQQGDVPVQAYSMLVRNHCPDTLAEHLHQRWLADGRFAQIAANMILHIHKADPKEMGLWSCVLALLLNDFRSRLQVRSQSALMFRNSVKAIFAMYPIYREIDRCVSMSLIKPMFKCLDLLIDNHPELDDVETMAVLMSHHGHLLNELNSFAVDKLIVKIRAKLCSDEAYLTSHVRKILLHVIDLWCFGWSELLIPDSLTMSYEEENEEETLSRKHVTTKKEFGSKESIV